MGILEIIGDFIHKLLKQMPITETLVMMNVEFDWTNQWLFVLCVRIVKIDVWVEKDRSIIVWIIWDIVVLGNGQKRIWSELFHFRYLLGLFGFEFMIYTVFCQIERLHFMVFYILTTFMNNYFLTRINDTFLQVIIHLLRARITFQVINRS